MQKEESNIASVTIWNKASELSFICISGLEELIFGQPADVYAKKTAD